MKPTLGVIGGSGVYTMGALTDAQHHTIATPYGDPSGEIVSGRIGSTRVLFLARHGRGHTVSPSAINYRANICALKLLGATHVVSLSAVGSMKEQIAPGDFVIVDQYIDLTKRRVATFFDEGVTAHVGMADPACPALSAHAADAARAAGATVHDRGTYVCIEGPQFSTRAESRLYRSWGVDVIGMTALPEAKLAREAELPYCTVALVTDYDVWHDTEEAVTVQAVVAVLKQNAARAERLVEVLAGDLPDPLQSPAARALDHAIITAPTASPPQARARLEWLLASRAEQREAK